MPDDRVGGACVHFRFICSCVIGQLQQTVFNTQLHLEVVKKIKIKKKKRPRDCSEPKAVCSCSLNGILEFVTSCNLTENVDPFFSLFFMSVPLMLFPIVLY